MRQGSLESSPRSHTYAAVDGELWDHDGIKLAIATATTAQSYSGADFDGALGNAAFDPPRFASVTSSSAAGNFNTGANYPIVFTGTRGGKTVTESILLTQTNGGETVIGNQPFDEITGIDVAVQKGAAGTLSFGVDGLASRIAPTRQEEPYRWVRTDASGSLKVGYPNGRGGYNDDTLPAGYAENYGVSPSRIYGEGGTDVKITAYE